MTLEESNNLSSKETIEYSEEVIQKLFSAKLPLDWNKLKREKKSELVHQWAREAFPNVPASLVTLTVGLTVDGDSGTSIDEIPEWLDREKFARGQKFAQDNIFGIFFSILLTLFGLYSFEDGLNPLIITGKSSEPYTAFKRYLSTGARFRNWFTGDLWTKGTPAYNDIKTVRRVHAIIRNKLNEMSNEEINKATTIENPWSPMRNSLLKDFRSACPVALPGQCPFTTKTQGAVQPQKMHQGEMAMTQGGFVCLVVLYPQALGIHGATDKELHDFCYVWRCIGYLLGIEDEFNFCRGTLEDIKQRSADYLNSWVKPNFRDMTPEFEHMMRCLVVSSNYFSSNTSNNSFEMSLLYFTELIGLDMPQLRASLSYSSWIKHHFMKFTMHYAMQLPQIKKFLNFQANKSMNDALKFTNEKHAELQQKSSKILSSVTSETNSENIFTQYKIYESLLIIVLCFFGYIIFF
ncbi:uncharacterized protein LOC103570506 [Microplitis demolitor]|uniref:uncharacterized protein LOC103570506 n=1 Tax=Microplitis demolitor TaxID=69319 RepID=UPI0004CDBA96|nr:uncharacterized protein LOC103570506 [Microplitis demolitor]